MQNVTSAQWLTPRAGECQVVAGTADGNLYLFKARQHLIE